MGEHQTCGGGGGKTTSIKTRTLNDLPRQHATVETNRKKNGSMDKITWQQQNASTTIEALIYEKTKESQSGGGVERKLSR